jgi:hypothetical protein
MMNLKIGVIGLILLINACGSKNDPQEIINKVIENHGGERYENFSASFDFRGRHYVLQHKEGLFQYERHFSSPDGNIKDVLNNQGFKRFLDERDITDTVKKAAAYARSVNSVAYFALLPYRLNDPAVNKSYLGTGEIKGEPYHKILVTFDQEGGGDDYTDEFVYWIHPENYTMDYFAYLYYTDGGGKRFRAPLNVRTVGGIRFSDYENYKEVDDHIKIEDYDRQYNEDKLELLSKIVLENLEVSPG